MNAGRPFLSLTTIERDNWTATTNHAASQHATSKHAIYNVYLSGIPVASQLLFRMHQAERDLLLRVHRHYISPHIMAASWTNDVRWQRCGALRAGGQLLGSFRVMSPTFSGSRIRMFSFGDCHVIFGVEKAFLVANPPWYENSLQPVNDQHSRFYEAFWEEPARCRFS